MSNAWAKKAAQQIWVDLSNRRGFGLRGFEYEDPDLFGEIQRIHTKIIRDAANTEGEGVTQDVEFCRGRPNKCPYCKSPGKFNLHDDAWLFKCGTWISPTAPHRSLNCRVIEQKRLDEKSAKAEGGE